MPKEKKQTKVKKISKEKKVKEIGLKKKEIKKAVEKSDLVDEIEQEEKNIDNEEFVEFLQQPIRSSPVLERVAVAGEQTDLEDQLALVQRQQTPEREENTIRYNETQSEYFSVGGNTRERRDVEYVSTGDYGTMLQQNKESEETRRLTGMADQRSEWADRGNDRFSMERQAFVEEDKETRKYMSKGDYK